MYPQKKPTTYGKQNCFNAAHVDIPTCMISADRDSLEYLSLDVTRQSLLSDRVFFFTFLSKFGEEAEDASCVDCESLVKTESSPPESPDNIDPRDMLTPSKPSGNPSLLFGVFARFKEPPEAICSTSWSRMGLQHAMTSSEERTSAEAEVCRLPHRGGIDGLLRPPALEQILGIFFNFFFFF